MLKKKRKKPCGQSSQQRVLNSCLLSPRRWAHVTVGRQSVPARGNIRGISIVAEYRVQYLVKCKLKFNSKFGLYDRFNESLLPDLQSQPQSILIRNNCRSLAGWFVGNWTWPAGSTVWTYHNDLSFGRGFNRRSTPITYRCFCDEGCSALLLQWFVVVQQAKQALPQLMDRIWLTRHSRFSNSLIFDSATNLIQLFLRFYGTISWWFGGAIFTRLWSNCKNTQRAHPDKSPQLIGLSEVHNDTASPRSAPTAYRSNPVTLRTRDL